MRAPAMPRVSPRFTTPALALTLALSLMLAGGASAGPAAAPAANAPAPAARSSTAPAAAPAKADRATAAVDAAVADVMRQYGIAGMAIGVSRDGEQRFFNYGDASREPRRAVSSDTLFELGSVSYTHLHQLQVFAAKVMGVAGAEITERHAVLAAHPGVQFMDLAGETIGRQPAHDGVGFEESAVHALSLIHI